MLDLVGNPEDRFSRVAAHFMSVISVQSMATVLPAILAAPVTGLDLTLCVGMITRCITRAVMLVVL